MFLLIGALAFVVLVGWLALKIYTESVRVSMAGFQPPEMAMAQYTPKDVIGDLGGMKVRIPRACPEYVEYDGDPGFGEKRKGPVPERTFESKLSSFGIDARLPDLRCKENPELREDLRRTFLTQDNPWIHISISAGERYPKLGARATDAEARYVTDTITHPTKYWQANYERLPESAYELEAYVVTGINPRTRNPARNTENDWFIHRDASGKADTVFKCGKIENPKPKRDPLCTMRFSMEPDAKVFVEVTFRKTHLPKWQDIRQSVDNLLTSYKVTEVEHKQAPGE